MTIHSYVDIDLDNHGTCVDSDNDDNSGCVGDVISNTIDFVQHVYAGDVDPNNHLRRCQDDNKTMPYITIDGWRLMNLVSTIISVCVMDRKTFQHDINSLRLSYAYMRQWHRRSLVHAMAYRPLGAKPLSKPSRFQSNWILGNKFWWKLNQNVTQEN